VLVALSKVTKAASPPMAKKSKKSKKEKKSRTKDKDKDKKKSKKEKKRKAAAEDPGDADEPDGSAMVSGGSIAALSNGVHFGCNYSFISLQDTCNSCLAAVFPQPLLWCWLFSAECGTLTTLC
jgi:hypothetical protein